VGTLAADAGSCGDATRDSSPIHQALDVHGDVAAQVAFDIKSRSMISRIWMTSDSVQVADPAGGIDPQLGDDLVRGCGPMPWI